MNNSAITVAGPEAAGDSGFQKLTDSDGNGVKVTLPDFESGDTQPGGTYIVPMRIKFISRQGSESQDQEDAEGAEPDEDRNEPGEGAEIEIELLAAGTPMPVKDQRPMSFPREEGGGDEGEMMSNLRAATGPAPDENEPEND